MNSCTRPIVGITMGDPAGCGPEITVKSLADEKVYRRCRPVVVGDSRIIEGALAIAGHTELKVRRISEVHEALFQYGTIDVCHLDLISPEELVLGKVSAQAGDAAFHSVKKVIELALDKQLDATVTNALNKEAINLAGHHYSGHTEIYAELTGTRKYVMMLAYRNLRVAHVSTHVSLREACDRVTKARVLDVIRIATRACIDLGIASPKIGVAGLNPHAGENGLFGTEELSEIIPAIQAARAEGIDADGPLPPDTAFSKARGGWYDLVVCMYHDQGHIPLKTIGFIYDQGQARWEAVEGVNVTLGLPIIRVSVDHGTAFDNAGAGVASALSLSNAIDYAVQLAEKRMG